MKNRYAPIVTLAVAILLVSGIAYAAEKKKQTRAAAQEPETVREEEAVKAELLAAVEGEKGKAPRIEEAAGKRQSPAGDKRPGK